MDITVVVYSLMCLLYAFIFRNCIVTLLFVIRIIIRTFFSTVRVNM